MAVINLRSYIREIEKHVESGRNDEAIAHCRHILESYPKYTEAYRLLGKAFLESQRYGDAADIFQRVLSSTPDDFVSHVGMSIIREDEGNLDEAIWHMERAFEIQPANSTIQDELRRLYGRRDGVEPSKIRLTRGALARMYSKGELYPQAIAETRATLAENPDRLDMQVFLSDIYFKAGQRIESADIANSILRKLPYCLTANQVMAFTLSGTEREQEAQVFRQRLKQLDPYTAFMNPNNPIATSISDQAVMMEKLDWKPGQVAGGIGSQPIWATSLGVELDELTPGRDEPLPDWLTETPAEKPMEAVKDSMQSSMPAFSLDSLEEISAPDQPTTPSVSPTTATSDEVPEWISDVGWEPSIGKVGEMKATIDDAEKEEPTALEKEGNELAAADIPDWLRAMAPIPGPEETFEVEEDVSPWLDELFTPGKAEVTPSQFEATETVAAQEEIESPDWLTSRESIEDRSTEAAISEDELPAWLFESENIPVMATSVEERATPTEDELPVWVFEDESSPFESVPSEAEPITPTEELPEWSPEGETLPTEDVSARADAGIFADELPEWLREDKFSMTESTLAEAEPTTSVQETPDWLLEGESLTTAAQSAEGEEISTEAAIVESEAPPLAQPVEEVPSWLLEEEIPTETAPIEDTQPARVSLSQRETTEPPSEVIIDEIASQEPAPIEDIDSAFTWLESLAVKQDDEETKVFRQPEQLEIPPESIQQAVEEAARPEPISSIAVGEFQPESEKLEEIGVSISELTSTEVEAKPTATLAEDEAAFAWLEGLAVKQGAEEALLLKPEDRLETPPEWIQQSLEAENQLEVKLEEILSREEEAVAEATALTLETVIVEEEEEQKTEIFAKIPGISILAEEPPPSPEEVYLEPELPTPVDEEMTSEAEAMIVAETIEEAPELPGWLSETTIEKGGEAEWKPPAPVVMYDLNQVSLAELERLPGIGFIMAQQIIDFREINGPFTMVDDLLQVQGFSPITLEECRESLYVKFLETIPDATVEEPTFIIEKREVSSELAETRNSLSQGNLDEALEKYASLIQSGHHLSEIIQDLEEIAGCYPQELNIWQNLGDAYLRSNQLQQALDAYIQAEKLLL